jgi:hypothetical protein
MPSRTRRKFTYLLFDIDRKFYYLIGTFPVDWQTLHFRFQETPSRWIQVPLRIQRKSLLIKLHQKSRIALSIPSLL